VHVRRLARAVTVRYHRNFGACIDEEKFAGTMIVNVYPRRITDDVQGGCPVRAFQFSAAAAAEFSPDFGLKLQGGRQVRARLPNLAW